MKRTSPVVATDFRNDPDFVWLVYTNPVTGEIAGPTIDVRDEGYRAGDWGQYRVALAVLTDTGWREVGGTAAQT